LTSPASSSPRAPSVVALYGPTASGKSAVARALLDRLEAEVVSADSAALYAGMPILTAAPDYPARLVGVVPLHEEVSAGRYQALAHAAIDEVLDAGRTAIVVGGTGLYLRAALSSIELPPPPEPGARERWSSFYDTFGSEHAHRLLAEQDPDAAGRIHANDRKRVIRALELAGAGISHMTTHRLWAHDARLPTLLVGVSGGSDDRIHSRVLEMVDAGVVEEAKHVWAQPLSATARKVLGLEQFATLPLDEAVEAVASATRRLARYQRKWLRRLAPAATLAADRAPEEVADEILALAGARERLPGR
jgi:tRNA dimethylallyltransferase